MRMQPGSDADTSRNADADITGIIRWWHALSDSDTHNIRFWYNQVTMLVQPGLGILIQPRSKCWYNQNNMLITRIKCWYYQDQMLIQPWSDVHTTTIKCWYNPNNMLINQNQILIQPESDVDTTMIRCWTTRIRCSYNQIRLSINT